MCIASEERKAWLQKLPSALERLQEEWRIMLEQVFPSDAGYVVAATLPEGIDAVLKLGMPHMEARDELAGLAFWNGDPTVHVLQADEESGAILLERCRPGTSLRILPEHEQDVVIAGLLRRLWRNPRMPHPFRPLAEMTRHWSEETLAQRDHWFDEGLVREGLRLFQELPQSAKTHVLLATDLHAGNVLQSRREPWLAIDPKPFLGEPAYDATQHLLHNCQARMAVRPEETIRRFADLSEVDYERVRLWMFARAAAEPRDDWNHPYLPASARRLRV